MRRQGHEQVLGGQDDPAPGPVQHRIAVDHRHQTRGQGLPQRGEVPGVHLPCVGHHLRGRREGPGRQPGRAQGIQHLGVQRGRGLGNGQQRPPPLGALGPPRPAVLARGPVPERARAVPHYQRLLRVRGPERGQFVRQTAQRVRTHRARAGLVGDERAAQFDQQRRGHQAASVGGRVVTMTRAAPAARNAWATAACPSGGVTASMLPPPPAPDSLAP